MQKVCELRSSGISDISQFFAWPWTVLESLLTEGIWPNSPLLLGWKSTQRSTVSKGIWILHFSTRYFRNCAIFHLVLKPIQDCSVFASLRVVIGPSNSHHPFNQSDAKPKPIKTWSPAFSRALGIWVSFTLSSHWLSRVFFFLLIGCWDYFGFGFGFGFGFYDNQSKRAQLWDWCLVCVPAI